jgi:hypothetical protein
LVDNQGLIRYNHIGEGDYAQTEKMIKSLLAEGTLMSDLQLSDQNPEKYIQVRKRGQLLIYLLLLPNKIYFLNRVSFSRLIVIMCIFATSYKRSARFCIQ